MMSLSIWDIHVSGGLITVILGCVVLFLVHIWIKSGSTYYNLPPGPPPYPLIGNLSIFLNAKDLPQKFLELREIYGNVFKLHLGLLQLVIITGLPTIREGLVEKGKLTNGRANWIYWINKLTNKKGVLFSDGHQWKNMRHFSVSTLRSLGVGKKQIQFTIYEELEEVYKAIAINQGRSFELNTPIIDAVTNIIYSILFGERLEYDHPDFKKIKFIFFFLFKNGSNRLIENFLPCLEYIPWKTTAKKIFENDQWIRMYTYRKIQEHRETFNEDNIRDFIDMYLLRLKKENNENFTEPSVFRTIVDIFFAGSETTATTLNWLFLYVTKYPDVQKNCREEIVEMTGMNRSVKMEDKKYLPYVCATINEVQRMATIVPSTIPHVAEQDITLGGYDIPKGTIIQFLIDTAHKDPKYWKNPYTFDPSRWLDEEVKLKQNESFIPFSLGPRVCLGKSLAEMELFLFFTNLIQKFEFLSEEDQPVSVSGTTTGITHQPDSTRIRALPLKE